MMFNRALWAYVVVSVMVAGCGGPDGPLKVEVSGKVTIDDEPLTGVAVYFSSEAGGGGRAYNLGEDGTFTSDLPLLPGQYQVSICQMTTTPETTTPPADETSKVPAAYLSPKSSGLTAMVTEDGENFFEFKLSSDKTGGDASSGIRQPDVVPLEQ